MNETNKHRIFGLDAIRALAILLVLLSHSSLLLFPNQENSWLIVIRFFGTIGVDLFFVLSGFLIGEILLKQINSNKILLKDFLYFWIRRWFRTLPNYYFILIINICLVFIFSGKIVDGIGSYFLFLQNFASAQQNFFTESWSLSIEEFAYLIGPSLLYFNLILVKKVPKHILYFFITILVIIIVTVCRCYFHFHTDLNSGQEWSSNLRKVVVYRIDGVYYGFLAVYVKKYFNNIWSNFKVYSVVLGLSLFFGMHLVIFTEHLSPENAPLFFNVFYLPLVAISLLSCFPFVMSLTSKGFMKYLITKLSVLSYAIYLINYSIVLLTMQQFIDISVSSFLVKILVLLTYWGLTVALSYMLFTYFEKPFMDLRDRQIIKTLFQESPGNQRF